VRDDVAVADESSPEWNLGVVNAPLDSLVGSPHMRPLGHDGTLFRLLQKVHLLYMAPVM
jgi:hypothetical protein